MKDLAWILLASVVAGVLASRCDEPRRPRWRWCPDHRDTLTENMNGQWRRDRCR